MTLADPTLQWLQSIGALTPLAAALLLYAFGMGLNDFRDRSRDRLRHPNRPLPSGQLAPRRVLFMLSMIGGMASVAIAASGGDAIAPGFACLACILAYDLAFKDIPALGPLAMGGVRASLILFGASSVGEIEWQAPDAMPILTSAVLVGLYTSLVTWFSELEEDGTEQEERRRARWLLLSVAIGGACALQAGKAEWSAARILPLALPILWLGGYAFRPLLSVPPRPEVTTFRALVGLPLLDLCLLLSYDHYLASLLPLVLWLTLLRYRRANFAIG